MICGAIFTGCSTQTEKEEPESSSQTSQPEEQENSSESDESSSVTSSSGGSTTVIVVPPSSSSSSVPSSAPTSSQSSSSTSSSEPQKNEITGALVMNSADFYNSIFGSSTSVLGTEKDLEAWNKAISERDSIGKILISTWNTERNLTENEISTVLDTLAALSPNVMEKLGNPFTGGGIDIVAYDKDGDQMWGISLTGNWLIVQVSGDSSQRILEINEADAAPIQNIAA